MSEEGQWLLFSTASLMNVSERSVQPGAGSAIPQLARLNSSALAKGPEQSIAEPGDCSMHACTAVTRAELEATLALTPSHHRLHTWLIQVDIVGGELLKSS